MDVSQPIRRPGRTAIVWRDKTIVGLLEALQRHRELNGDESVLMERTVRRLTPRRDIWKWTPAEDRRLKAFIRKRARIGRPKPFQPNDEVRILAAEMGRTYMAVHRRIERLRKQGKVAKVKKWAVSTAKGRTPRPPKPAPDMTGTVDANEAAAMLGVPVTWLQHLRSQGGGPPYVKIGKVVRYPIDKLKRFPAQQIRAENVANQERLKKAVHKMADDYEEEIGMRKCSRAKPKRQA